MTLTRRRLAVLAPLGLLLATGIASAYAFARMYEMRNWVHHTHFVIEAAGRVSNDLSQAESAQRGYLLTGEPMFVPRYARSLAELQRDTLQLRQLTRDNPSQQRRLDALASRIGERVRLLNRGVTLRQAGVDSAAALSRLEQGRLEMEAARSTMRDVETEEQQLLSEREAAEQRRLAALAVVFLLGVAGVAVAAYLTNHALVRYAEGEREAREQIEAQNEELQQQGVELELQAENLEQQAAELEMVNEQLHDGTQLAERALLEAETEREAVRELSTELKARVAELETMFERLPVGLCISYDPECLSIRVNPAFAKMVGVSTDENISSGRPDADIALPYTIWRNGGPAAVEDQPMQLAARTRQVVEGVDLDLHFRDGHVLHLYGWAAPLFGEAGEVRGAIAGFVDVTQREKYAQEIARLAGRAEKLYALTSALSRAATPEEVGAVACDWGRVVLGASAAIFCALSPDGSALEPLHVLGVDEQLVARWRRVPVDAHTPLAEALRRGERVCITSAAERDAAFPDFGSPAGLEALLSAPLRLEQRTLGAWTVHFDEARGFSDDDLQLFEAVTVLCAQALERTRLYEAERQARSVAEEANQAKLKFLRVMSHDLRTPLNAILGYTELLQESVPGPLNELQRSYLGRVRASTGALRTLIDDILEFARIEAGRVEMRPADIPVVRLLDSVEALVAPQIRAKGIHLVRSESDAALVIRADPDRARQIMMNLVSNAQKFTSSGGEIVLSWDGDHTRVRISVSDTGVGIPAAELERIFEPFVQVHRPEELGIEQGVGLGLAISRELARAMGGDVIARAEPGVGSIFTLELPRAQDRAAPVAIAAAVTG
jgi:signal transduction histidine kinase/CHASE3 domain sensor protein